MSTSFAYIHCKPNKTPFYVGKGTLRRVNYLGERNPHHQAVVSKYGKQNILIGKLECSSSEIAFKLEKGLIKCLKSMNVKLTNFTDGGEGTSNPTPETRIRLSEAAKKRGVSQACHNARAKAKKGKPLSEEQKKKQSEAMKGIAFTEEHKKNISISAKKRGISNATREAALIASTGRKVSNEEKLKRSQSALAYWDKKGRKEKIQKINKGNCWVTRKSKLISVDGVIYRKMKDAAKSIGVHSASIVYALKNSGKVKGHKVMEIKHVN